ncbi:tape measure protein [Ottowia beijingensis]|uniref:Tape measure protein n=1 Tax=Ottowia beijingensis TaxID=1207057 RepID=A0A853IT82_9BURK|nr:tape measure protein [Ottowia beijingensis]
MLRGDEFNSVMEQAPRLARALADGLKVTTGELRAMSQAGKLSADTVIRALQSQADVLEQEFGTLPQTIGRSMENLATSWSLFVSQADQASGASQKIASAIDLLADNLDTVATVAWRAGQVMLAMVAIKTVKTVYEFGVAALSSARALDAVAASGARAGAAINVASAAQQRFAHIARSLGYATIADQVLRISMAYMELRQQQQQQAQLTDALAEKDARAARRLSEISQATGVLVRSMEELNAAQASGALVFSEAEGRWMSAAQAQQQLGLAAENTADRLAGLNAAAAVEQFHAIVEESGKAEEALKKLVEGLRFDDATSVAGFTRALEALRNGGTLTAQQVGDAWQQALAKLDAGQIDRVRTQLEAAAAQGVISAQQLAQVNDQILTASFARLGVNSAQALGQISKGAQDAIGSVALVMETLDAAGAQSEEAARAIELAFAAAVPKADSLEAVAALEQQLAAVGESGKIGAAGVQRVQEALDRQRAAIHDQLPGIQSLGEALRQLGVKPQAELNAMAHSARTAFDMVKASGSATARELNDAWRVMAEAQIAANNGVADAALVAQAKQHGFVIQADEAGKAVVVSMADAIAAMRQFGGAAERAGMQARGAGEEAAEGADAAREAHEQAAQAIEFTWLSARTQASRYADEAARHAETMVGTLQKYLGTGMSWNQYIGAWNSYYGDLRRMAEEYAAALEGIDARQQALERRNSGAAKGVDDLRMRLLELSGSEEEIAQARAARDRAEVERQIQLAQLEAERASVRGDHGAAQRFAEEVALLQEQLSCWGRSSAPRSASARSAARAVARAVVAAAARRAAAAARVVAWRRPTSTSPSTRTA